MGQIPLQNNLQGVQLSHEIYRYLSDEGFDIEQQELFSSDTTRFPQNLAITISAENEGNSNKKSNDSSKEKNIVETIVFDIPQEFAYKNLSSLSDFLNGLKDSSLSYRTVVLLSANDSFPDAQGLEKANKNHPSGTDIFTEKLGYDNSYAAILVDQITEERRVLVPGSDKTITPLWLLKNIYEGLKENGFSPKLTSFFSLSHFFSLAPHHQRLSSFFEKGISSCAVNLDTDSKSYETLLSIAQKLSDEKKDSRDCNYLFFKIGEMDFWVSETSTITFSLFSIIIVLLLICFTGVLPTAKSKALLKDIGRCWFVYPLTIVFVTLVLHGTQSIFSSLAYTSPLLLNTLKIFFTFVLIFFVFLVLAYLNIRISLGAYGFLMVASAVLNIFVFSCISLVLLYFFMIEFFLIFLSQHTKSTAALIATNLLTLIPFLMLLWNILDRAVLDRIKMIGPFTWQIDVLLAMILFPFIMQLVRILISTDLLSQSKKNKTWKLIATIIIAEAAMALVLWIFYAAATYLLNKSLDGKTKSTQMAIKNKDFPTTVIDLKETAFMELSLRTLTVKSPEKVLRYEITIESENAVPIFESNYQYTLEGGNKIRFVIPDQPEGILEIIYSADSTEFSHIQVDTFLLSDKGDHILKESCYMDTEVVSDREDGQ